MKLSKIPREGEVWRSKRSCGSSGGKSQRNLTVRSIGCITHVFCVPSAGCFSHCPHLAPNPTNGDALTTDPGPVPSGFWLGSPLSDTSCSVSQSSQGLTSLPHSLGHWGSCDQPSPYGLWLWGLVISPLAIPAWVYSMLSEPVGESTPDGVPR